MEKTITASFDSVDGASFAARRITSHFRQVKSVQVKYRKLDGGEGLSFTDRFAALSPGIIVTGQSVNGMYPGYAGSGIAGTGNPTVPTAFYAERGEFYEAGRNGGSEEGEPPEVRERATVRIIADEQDAGRIAATLLSSGGWDVRTT